MEHVRYEVVDPIATITLNRPETLNAWTDRMGREVEEAVLAAEGDPRVVVIVLTGAGRGFCSGADLGRLGALARGAGPSGEGGGLPPAARDPAVGDFRGAYTYLMSIGKPIIAAVNGPCAGMALPIALACDLRFASETAIFTSAFARRGLVAEWGSSWMLSRLVGTARAMDVLLSARRISAAEAAEMGLVNRVLPADELMSFTYGYARDMAEHCSPSSLAVIKRQIYEDLVRSLGAAEQAGVGLMLESFQRPDFAEGVQSFIDRRPPRFARLGEKET